MFVLIGLAVVFASIIAGYTMHGGQLLILFQVSEFLIIGGAAIGALLISNPPDMLRRIVQGVLATLRGNKLSKAAYLELLPWSSTWRTRTPAPSSANTPRCLPTTTPWTSSATR
jgi:flagellar motor component MotA